MAVKRADEHKNDGSIQGVWLKASGVPGIPKVDYDRYMAELEGYDYSDEEAHQLIETLHALAVGFVDIAMRVSATQTACGQQGAQQTALPKSAVNMLKSSGKSTKPKADKGGCDMPFARSHR